MQRDNKKYYYKSNKHLQKNYIVIALINYFLRKKILKDFQFNKIEYL